MSVQAAKKFSNNFNDIVAIREASQSLKEQWSPSERAKRRKVAQKLQRDLMRLIEPTRTPRDSILTAS